MKMLDRNVYNIQQIMNKKLKMRPVPKILFCKETKNNRGTKDREDIIKY